MSGRKKWSSVAPGKSKCPRSLRPRSPGWRLGGVEPLVVGDPHVEVALCHVRGHGAREQPGLEGLARDLLEPHRCAEHLGHDLRHVVVGEVLRTEYRATGDSAPGVIEQQTGSDGGDIAGGATWLLEAPRKVSRLS